MRPLLAEPIPEAEELDTLSAENAPNANFPVTRPSRRAKLAKGQLVTVEESIRDGISAGRPLSPNEHLCKHY